MKKIVWASVIGIVFLSGCIMYVPRDWSTEGPYDRDRWEYDRYYGDTLDMDYLYDQLSLYGTWVWYPPYGYVWLPDHASRWWRPYTYGQWVWTDYGWTWVSSEPWGWICYHYGRWGWDLRLGWFWVPDTVWGPAWVVWRWGGLYIGWAPMPPRYGWHSPYAYDDVPDHYWIFIEGRHFVRRSIDRYALSQDRNRELVRRTVPKSSLRRDGDSVINDALTIAEVERISGERVSSYKLKEAVRPGQEKLGGQDIEVYKRAVTEKPSAKPKKALTKEEAEKKASSRVKKDEPEAESEAATKARVRKNDEPAAAERPKSMEKNNQVLRSSSRSSSRESESTAKVERRQVSRASSSSTDTHESRDDDRGLAATTVKQKQEGGHSQAQAQEEVAVRKKND